MAEYRRVLGIVGYLDLTEEVKRRKTRMLFCTLGRNNILRTGSWDEKKDGWVGLKRRESAPDRGPKKSILGPLGRGVLRFGRRGIQESRSYFGQKWPFFHKICRFRGWCNTAGAPSGLLP